MSRDMFIEFHQAAAFDELARAAGLEQIVAEYRARGVGFFFLPRQIPAPPTGYNRDFVNVPGCQEGDVHIRPDDLEGGVLSRGNGFACRLLHELGHYESLKQRLNHRCELLAWYIAGKMAQGVYGNQLPDWWASIRQQALSSHQTEWDEELAESCSRHRCTHV